MKIVLAFLMLAGLLAIGVNAGSEPVCSYRNNAGETIFLKYLPLLKQGQDYVDFGADGKCMKRAVCTENFKTEVEDCAKHRVTCGNKKTFPGVFPGCCVKC
ncbi:uncharacterized protein LOC129245256 [Anastrepha obliqua]|uniref:uncharacterized protein LOC129245256 n=1 Tax=Anastrepha obliqua TaxID=95512 RepID=UPI002409B310|nr:uncharacterized protein LOC129245256 [Anastrepha obliqua]